MAPDFSDTNKNVVAHLQSLIRADTTNPPGNESRAAGYLIKVLTEAGIDVEVVESAPERANVIARLKGHEEASPLLLLCHLDVVPAEREAWSEDPFAGKVTGGEVWGRGALDCKGLAALWTELLIQLKRSGLPLRRDVILAATADEEMGGQNGLGWLVEKHPELIDAEYCLNEGGGNGLRWGDRLYYFYQTAEKGICWLQLTAHGTPGHASMPLSDNAILLLARALQSLEEQPTIQPGPIAKEIIQSLADDLPEPEARGVRGLLDPDTYPTAIEAVKDPFLRQAMRAILGNTMSATVIRGGSKTNVIPGTADVQLDCRILPGQTPEQMRSFVEDRLRAALGPDADRIDVNILRESPATQSEPETELTEALRHGLSRHAPEARLLPYLEPGGTDARFLRPRGVTVYGVFFTLPEVDRSTMHGHNERISVESLDFAFRVLWDTVVKFAAKVA